LTSDQGVVGSNPAEGTKMTEDVGLFCLAFRRDRSKAQNPRQPAPRKSEERVLCLM
jgi:hypothetical protein